MNEKTEVRQRVVGDINLRIPWKVGTKETIVRVSVPEV